MNKFFHTLFERASRPEGRPHRRRAGFSFALSVALSLWAFIWWSLNQGHPVLDDFLSIHMPKTIALYCALLGIGAGGAFYMAMAWWGTWSSPGHAALLGVLTTALAACVTALLVSLGHDFIAVVLGAWSITAFSVLFARGLPGIDRP